MKIDNVKLRTVGKLAMVAAMILGAVTVLGVPATASSTMDRAGARTTAAPPALAAVTGSTLYHQQSDRCLDAAVSVGVRLNTCNGGSYQRWIGTSAFQLVNDQSDRCLDGSVSSGVRLMVCNSGDYQEWYSNSPPTVPRTIIHRQSGRCLDGSVSGGVRLKVCNGSAYQIWY